MKKGMVFILVSVLTAVMLNIQVFAAESEYRLFYTTDKDSYDVGDEIKVTLTLEKTSGEGYNLRNFADTIIYNREFLELKSVDDVADGFNVTDTPVAYNKQYDKLTARYQYLKTEGDPPLRNVSLTVCTMSFKALENASGTLFHADTSVWLEPYSEETVEAQTLTYLIGTPKEFKISFKDGGEASGSMDSITAKTGDKVVMPENGFTKTGYVFDGWELGGKLYPSGSTYVMGAEDVMFTAKWSEDTTPSTPKPTDTPIPESTPTGGSGAAGGSSNSGKVTPMPTATAGAVIASPTVSPVPTEKPSGECAYYTIDGRDIFIGFADGSKYIAPEGAEVRFRYNKKTFTDTSSHWAEEYIDFVTSRELFLGTGDDGFSPEGSMTRAMFATVIGRLYERSYGEIGEVKTAFEDVTSDSWYANYVGWAAESGIVNGVGENRFAPDAAVTREEMSVLIYRFAGFLGKVSEVETSPTLTYTDSGDIAEWAVESAGYAAKNGIISGNENGEFSPKNTATRAEVSAIITRFIKNIVNS